jgi:hypothetical protein
LSIVGWLRLRELDEVHTLGRLRRNLERIARTGRLPADNIELLDLLCCSELLVDQRERGVEPLDVARVVEAEPERAFREARGA